MSSSPTAIQKWLREYIEKESKTLQVSLRLYVIRAGLATTQSAPDVATELLNEVVKEALTHADRLDSTRVTKAWLLGIANNLISGPPWR